MIIDRKLDAINAFRRNDYQKTVKICEEIILSKKETSDIFNIYGLALQKQNLISESKKKFKKAIQLDANNFEAFNNYAISLKRTLDLELAEKMYLKALKIKPNYIQALFNFAELKIIKQNHTEAINLYLSALKISHKPQEIFIKVKLFTAYRQIGKFSEAKKIANEVLKIDNNNLEAIKTLSELTNPNEDRIILNKMIDIKNNVNLKTEQLIFLLFQLGKDYERIKDYNNAYKCYNEANLLKSKLVKSPILKIKKVVNDIKDNFKNLNFSEFKKETSEKKVIFIIGLPRSGTTLVEQIISSHSEVLATGEIQILRREISNLFYLKEINLYEDAKINTKALLDEKFSRNNSLQKKYLQYLKKTNFDSKVYTDKSIENFFYIGFIKIFFPNSKIIFTERDKKDVFLSIFKNEFQSAFMNWTYNKKHILEYFDIYSDLIFFWKDLLPDEFYNVDYEKLVENPEYEIKNLINFCDLTWDPKCLEHHKNTSVIKTASVLQARNPIYKTSKKSFENYSQFFRDIFPL